MKWVLLASALAVGRSLVGWPRLSNGWSQVIGRLENRRQVGRLADGVPVWSRLGDDHLVAHPEVSNLLAPALSAVSLRVAPGHSEAIVHEFDHEVGFSTCVEVTAGDEVFHVRRPGRTTGCTRFVRGREPEPCATLVMWLHRNPEGLVVLRTAYVGSLTPPEPTARPAQASPDAWDRAVAFWRHHALIWPSAQQMEPETCCEAAAYWGARPHGTRNAASERF